MKKIILNKSALIIKRFLKRLVGIGTILTLLILYFSYYPDINLEVKEVIKLNEPMSEPVIISNPNPYSIDSIYIDITYNIDQLNENYYGITFNNLSIHNGYFIKSLKPDQQKRIPSTKIITSEFYKLKSAQVTFKISYKTPFCYPNTDSIKFTYDVEKYQHNTTKWIISNIKY